MSAAADQNEAGLTGLVFNIQLHSTEDGPGIRTSLFMKGCVMKCPWCHNPEGLQGGIQLTWRRQRCMGAFRCAPSCPRFALDLTPEGVAIDRRRCDACGECVRACPSGAMELIGREYGLAEVLERLRADKVFFEKSGGGVTISGGEVSMQTSFAAGVMRALKAEGIHLAIDTCGGTRWKSLEPLVDLADLVLYDLKIMDEIRHREVTGVPLGLVLDNARRVTATGRPMWVRTPIVPDHTDGEDNVRSIARFIHEHLPTVTRYDLLAFNHTCQDKYERLGMEWQFESERLIPRSRMERLAEVAAEEGLDFVKWSGFTRDTE